MNVLDFVMNQPVHTAAIKITSQKQLSELHKEIDNRGENKGMIHSYDAFVDVWGGRQLTYWKRSDKAWDYIKLDDLKENVIILNYGEELQGDFVERQMFWNEANRFAS